MSEKSLDNALQSAADKVTSAEIADVKEISDEVELQYVSGGGPRMNMTVTNMIDVFPE